MVGCERVLDLSEGDKVMMDAIIPHVRDTHPSAGCDFNTGLGLPYSRKNWNNTSITMPGTYEPRLQRRKGLL